MVVTEPVPDVIEEIGWTGGENIHDSRTLLHYFRTTSDGRIALGWGGGRMGVGGRHRDRLDIDSDAARHAAAALRRFFPQLADRRITHAWGGPIDVSPTHLPIFGSRGNVHHGFGFTGNGVGPSYLGGEILARLALDRRDEVTGLAIVEPDRKLFPPEPLRWTGGSAIRAALVRRDDAYDRGDHPDPLTGLIASLPRRRRAPAPPVARPGQRLWLRATSDVNCPPMPQLSTTSSSAARTSSSRGTCVCLFRRAAGRRGVAELEIHRSERGEEIRCQARLPLCRCDLLHLRDVPAGLRRDALEHPGSVVDEVGIVPAQVVEHELENAVRSRRAERLREERRLALVERGGRHLDRRGRSDLLTDDPKLEARRIEARNLGGPRSREIDDRRPGHPRRRTGDRAVDDAQTGGAEAFANSRHRHRRDGVQVGDVGTSTRSRGRFGHRTGDIECCSRRDDREDDAGGGNDGVERRQQFKALGERCRSRAPALEGCNDARPARDEDTPYR